MSTNEQALASVLSQLIFSCDGAVLGVGVALTCAAVRTVIKFSYTSKALRKLRNAPLVEIADLRAVLDQSQPSDAPLVVVRGTVEAKSAVDGGWNFLKPGVLVSKEYYRAVIIQRTQTCIIHEWKGFLGWQSDLRAIISRFGREHQSKSFKTVPFVLVEGGKETISDFVAVNLDGSRHPLPLTTSYHSLTPVPVSNYSFVQRLFGHRSPFGLLDEEKILPVGKEVSAVGHCTVKNGVPEIKSSNDLPYFLSDMSKDQMVLHLESQKKTLFWSAIVFGSMSVAALSYAAVRKWNHWRVSQQRQSLIAGNVPDNNERVSQQRQSLIAGNVPDSNEREVEEDEDAGDVPEGQLCVVCLMRRKRSAFIPCGHLVCCQPCSIAIELGLAPKCPVCRQEIGISVRIYDS